MKTITLTVGWSSTLQFCGETVCKLLCLRQ